MKQFPWDYSVDLSQKRLTEMANYIAHIRDEVIELHDEELGDSRLSLGMRAYECCRKRIIRACNDKLFSWLSILTANRRFTFGIGNTPVRFTRNDPKYLPDKKLLVSEDAQEQMDLFVKNPYAEIRWFFVFDTYYKSAADAVYFVGYSELGEIICKWQIPVEDNVTLISGVESFESQAVELEAPIVAVKKVDNDKTDSKDNG